jgi:hypothetical protein
MYEPLEVTECKKRGKIIAEPKRTDRIQSSYDDFSSKGSITSFPSPILNDTLTLTEVSVLNGN